ncbi:MAG TPA: PASTA domain-containing protein [Candidatus Binatia bacterium]
MYLRDSLKRMADLTVGNFNGDRYCDVKDDNGVVYLTPPGPELHGRRLQSLGSPAVYLILDGKRYLIPDAATYSNLFRNWEGIEAFDLSAISDGGTLSSDAKLARSKEEPTVYLITNGRKHWITSPQAMDTYNLDWNKIVYLDRSVIDSFARGGDLSAGPMGVTRSVVPDVRGQTVSAAFTSITAVGFARGKVRYYDDPTCNNIGMVTSQTPVAGSVVAAGTPVNLTVGSKPSTPCL